MKPSPKLLVVGLDAFDKDVALSLIAAGKLPNLARILNDSIWGETSNPPGMESGATWASFYTGSPPDKHGMYYAFLTMQPGTYDERKYERADFKARPFWDAMWQAGKRVAVIDAPYTFLGKDVKGLHIVDWGTHAPMSGPEGITHAFKTNPPELAREMEEKYGRDEIGFPDLLILDGKDEFAQFRDQLLDRSKRKTDMTLDLLGRGPWDCFFVAYHEAHSAGHLCWHLHDPSHPRYDAKLKAEVGDIVEMTYVATDQAIGRITAAVGPETMIVVLWSHGMATNVTGTRMLDDVLLRLEGFTIPEGRANVRRAIHNAWLRAPKPIKNMIAPLRVKLWPRVRGKFLEVDRAKRRCFEVRNNDATGGIRLNIKGREPNGLLEPGAEAEAFTEQLIADLKALVNPATGKPAVLRIVKTRDVYPGECSAGFPDLLIDWNREDMLRAVTSEKTGLVEHKDMPTRSGDHRPVGLFMAKGPGLAPRHLNERTSVYDFAPTLLAVLGLPSRLGTGKSIDTLVPPLQKVSQG